MAQLGAQLPMLVRGFYYEGWDPTAKPLKVRHRDDFLARVEQGLQGDGISDVEQAVRAVFRVLASRVTKGEIEDIRRVMPAEVRELWP